MRPREYYFPHFSAWWGTTSQAHGRVSNLNWAEVVLFLQSIGFDNLRNIRRHKECIQRVGIFPVEVA